MITRYIFWLVVVSVFCFILERIFPWRKEQKTLRPELLQDFFWLVFIGWGASITFGWAFAFFDRSFDSAFLMIFRADAGKMYLVSQYPLWLQVAIYLVFADFIEWCVHNLLHRVSWLWKIHRVHHSIKDMDWIGNFRMQWGELFVYRYIKYLPLIVLGARWDALLICQVFATLIGHLNHSNVNISWGPFRYILNSSRMHIWHHEKRVRGKAGVNFGIVFSIWDWLFGTAFMPKDALQPDQIGFYGEERVSHNLFMRFFLPFVDK